MKFWKERSPKQFPFLPESDKAKRECFRTTIETVQDLIDNTEYISEKASILDYAIRIIGGEVSYSVPARMLHTGSTPEDSEYTIPLPSSIHPLKGNYFLRDNSVVSEPWEADKLIKAILQVKADGFRQDQGYYTGICYREINMVIVSNGRHHLSAAFAKETGSAKLEVYSLKEAFPCLKTDGAYWYLDGHSPRRVFDYRIAVLYELAKIRHDMMLPENIKALKQQQFENEVNSSRSDAYGQLVRRISCLELEIAIKDYQITELKGYHSSQELTKQAQQLEKRCGDLRKDLDEWSQRYYDPWEHIAEKLASTDSSPQNNP